METAQLEQLHQDLRMLWSSTSLEQLLSRFAEICATSPGVTVILPPQSIKKAQQELPELQSQLGLSPQSRKSLLSPKTAHGYEGQCHWLTLAHGATNDLFVWQMRCAVPQMAILIGCCLAQAKALALQGDTQELVFQDELTSLYNFRYLKLALEREIAFGHRYAQPFSLLFIDVDNFKEVNDRFGHLIGSSVLKELAHVLKSCVRSIDCVVRYGGDEFVILLVKSAEADGLNTAKRITQAIAKHSFQTTPEKIKITVTIGVASYPQTAHTAQELLRLADQAMYVGKRTGKGTVSRSARDEETSKNLPMPN